MLFINHTVTLHAPCHIEIQCFANDIQKLRQAMGPNLEVQGTCSAQLTHAAATLDGRANTDNSSILAKSVLTNGTLLTASLDLFVRCHAAHILSTKQQSLNTVAEERSKSKSFKISSSSFNRTSTEEQTLSAHYSQILSTG